MRIFPLALIAIGVFGLLKHYGFIDPAFMQLFWPLLLIGIGVAMLILGPRWRAHRREFMQERWERRMNHRFGPGWSKLSEAERERFRAGMRRSHGHGCHANDTPEAPASTAAQAPESGEPR